MSRKEYQGLLKIASNQVPYGIYAVEKAEYAELRCDRCLSVTQIKKLKRQFTQNGYKVYVNEYVLRDADANRLQGGMVSDT